MTLYDFNNQPLLPPEPPSILPSFTVHWIFDPEGQDPSFAYTDGLGVRAGRAYELAVFGLPGHLAQVVLRCAAEQLVRDNLDPAEGLELDEVLTTFPVRLRLVQDVSRFPMDRTVSDPDTPIWQVLIPDKWGLFPYDRHYCDIRSEQPFV
ncbi:DUF4262 domain-containing protein [Streptomyces parvus]|uniref:DUF4262 domain-containing protein n=1 Tax=Streptomyces parvus TaxID=66428 RepID=UPI0033CF8F32